MRHPQARLATVAAKTQRSPAAVIGQLMSAAALASCLTAQIGKEGCLPVNSAYDAKSIVDVQQFYNYFKKDQQQNRVHKTAF